MIKPPGPAEWNTSQLPDYKRAYLDRGTTFEEMAARVRVNLQIVHALIKPLRDSIPGVPEETRQVVFLVVANDETCDLLYNAPDGLRGRYWQSPDHGFAATKYLIGTLIPSLVRYAKEYPPILQQPAAPMNSDDIAASLAAPCAKVWPREEDDDGNWLLVDDGPIVSRWETNQSRAPQGSAWQQSPNGAELEIKGALLRPDATEYLPERKRERPCEIHRFGFT